MMIQSTLIETDGPMGYNRLLLIMKRLLFVITTSFLLMTTQSFVTDNSLKIGNDTQSSFEIISTPPNCCCDIVTTIRHERDGTPYRAIICFNRSYETGVNVQCDYKIHHLNNDSYTRASRRNYVKPRSEWIVETTYDIENIKYENYSVYCVPVN